MKKKITTLVLLLLLLAGCSGNKQQTEDLIVVDVTKAYPEKEFVLQDLFDIEYVPLDTSSAFLTTGYLQDISEDMIVVRNLNRSSDGNIYLFDRKGKGIRIINRQGPGAEEYRFLLRVTLDEEKEELFVVDHWSRKVYVYDLLGNFKRSFDHKEGASYNRVFNIGPDYLIGYDGDNGVIDEIKNTFFILSKQDGSTVKEIPIPYDKKKTGIIRNKELHLSTAPRNEECVPFHDTWILMEHSSDTLYRIFPDLHVIPFIVRTPSIQSMENEIFLYPAVLTDRYYFMQAVKKEYDFVTKEGFPRTDLMYDREEKAIYKYSLSNADYTDKELVSLGYGVGFVNDEVSFVYKLEAPNLVEAYQEGRLKGRLKEIAAELNEESNPVLMIGKCKK